VEELMHEVINRSETLVRLQDEKYERTISDTVVRGKKRGKRIKGLTFAKGGKT